MRTSSNSKEEAGGSPKPLRVNQNERFHSELLSNFFQEYIQYLQTLGFMLIDLKQSVNKKSRSNLQQDSSSSESETRNSEGAIVIIISNPCNLSWTSSGINAVSPVGERLQISLK